MGIMKRMDTGLTLPLGHHTRIGRSSDADIRIVDKRISSEHAAISFDKGLWDVKDLGSRNGTVLDGRRLEAGKRVPLKVGAALRFGSFDAHWVLESDGPPDVVAIETDGEKRMEGEHGLLKWPSGAVLLTENGTDYYLESEGARSRVIDRQIVKIEGASWRISIPPSPDEEGRTITADGILLSTDVTLQFQVSPDEESVRVSIAADGVKKELRARSFDYMLLALARARIADGKTADLAADEQGWVYADELASDLGMDVSHINVDIYRARRRFADAGVQGADEMVERRPQTRALRLGCRRVELI
jgi:hypothetical protein